MLANWVKQTASAPGLGSATLVSVSGFSAMADQFAIGQPLIYEFINAAGLPIEAGIGSLTSSNVLSRDFVTNSMAGGVYSTANTPVNLTDSSYTVICSALKQLGTNSFGACHPSASYRCYIPSPVIYAGNTKGLTANVPFVVPVKIESLRGVASLGLEVTTLGGTSANKIRIGIYAAMPDGSVGPKLYECGDIDPSSTGAKSMPVVGGANSSVNGWAYAALLSDVTVIIHGGNSFHGQGSPLGMANGSSPYGRITCATVAAGWSVMPSTLTFSSFSALASEYPPLVYVYPA